MFKYIVLIVLWLLLGIVFQMIKHYWRGHLSIRGIHSSFWKVFLGPFGIKDLIQAFPKRFDFDFLHKIIWRKK